MHNILMLTSTAVPFAITGLSKKWKKGPSTRGRDVRPHKGNLAPAILPEEQRQTKQAESGSSELPPRSPQVGGDWPDDFYDALIYEISEEARQALEKLLGRLFAPGVCARLAFAAPGSKVEVRLDEERDVQITSSSDMVESDVAIQRSQGRLELILGSFTIRSDLRNQKLGTRLFAVAAHQAVELGMSSIAGYAIRGEDEAGYYAWPRLGFEGIVPIHVRQKLPPALRDAESILDLMLTAEGRQQWREHGESVLVRFDLRRGSRSWQVLDQYLQSF